MNTIKVSHYEENCQFCGNKATIIISTIIKKISNKEFTTIQYSVCNSHILEIADLLKSKKPENNINLRL